MGISVHTGIETGNEHIEQHAWGHTVIVLVRGQKDGKAGVRVVH